ncbi:MAG: N-formylglutamate amidohydrolase [Alphaproteobacteria bacterium]|nr:N-formylglutamate amidohydrolase [Alphaproteobacteria bacterium]
MHGRTRTGGESAYAIEVRSPERQTAPVVFSSPHSGRDYPAEFVAASRLDALRLRRSEDFRVDELFASAPRNGAPLLCALFPRAFVDVNREAQELDPGMFDAPLPPGVNSTSPRARAGFGTIARVVAHGEEIYARKLSFAEVRARIDAHYRPYHQALAQLVDDTRVSFGSCLLIDCHSMPSVGGPFDADAGCSRVDIVLGDANGKSAAPGIVAAVEGRLRTLGYSVRRNAPYSGGHITRFYGRPSEGVHALQIEINRGLYMDEGALRLNAGFAPLAADLDRLMGFVAGLEPTRAAA